MPVNMRSFHTFSKDFIKGINWDRINRGPLQQAGIKIRRKMRDFIRKDETISQKPSKPGRPPKSRHPGHPFRSIFSVPNKFETSVMIGHIGFSNKKPTPMEIHEFGRTVKIKTRQVNFKKRTRRGGFKSQKITVAKKYPERRFAEPAMNKVKSQIPALWRNSVRKGVVRSQ